MNTTSHLLDFALEVGQHTLATNRVRTIFIARLRRLIAKTLICLAESKTVRVTSLTVQLTYRAGTIAIDPREEPNVQCFYTNRGVLQYSESVKSR